MRFALSTLIVLAIPTLARAQELAQRRVEGRVTVVAGGLVYLDIGSDAGLEPGDRGRIFPTSGGGIEITVRSVSRQSASCEFVAAPEPVDSGALVEVLVPISRAGSTQTPEHPPWSQPTAGWDPSAPLLAPAKVPTPAERATDLSGRWYAGLQSTFDHQGDEQRYLLGRTGLDATLENAFGDGDVLRFDGEFYYRRSDDSIGDSESTRRTRIDRLSWRLGDWRTNPQRIEVGRFLHSEFSQLGILDGVEYVRRTAGGDRYGASLGLLPSWSDDLQTGDDVETALFYRMYAGDQGQLSLGAALQKTWHKGASDRDALLGDLSWRPNDAWWISTSVWFDYYGSHDQPKSSGVELTELFANAMWRPSSAWGMGASFAHVRWPVLERHELPQATLDALADGVVDRASLNSWHDLTDSVRLSLRADAWESQDDSGGGAEARLGRRDWLWEQGEVAAAVFGNRGEYSDVTGLRLSASRWSSAGSWSVWYEIAELAQDDFGGDVENLTQQVLRGNWDLSIGKWWSLGLFGETYFGDEQDSQTLGFQLQRRF